METYRILAQGQTVSNDTWATGLNNNDLIIGPSGAGKTRGYVLPNILQASESLIVTDTKGTLRQQAGAVLERNGYTFREIDLTDCLRSPCGYNPLRYVRYDEQRDRWNEQDIRTIAAAVVPVENHRDPFWEYAARMVLESLIGYVLECLPANEHTLISAAKLLAEMGGLFERLMLELAELDPDSFAVSRYKLYKSMSKAEKMYASVQGVLAEKLSGLTFDGVSALYNHPKQLGFVDAGWEKNAVFLHISDTDRSMDCLAALFYAQALQALCDFADLGPDNRLKVPVRLILDDFAAAADSCIPDFDKITSVIRSREISVSVILQSLSQLEASYGHARAMTIINNCDHLLYLGGQDVETARYISTKANKSINTVLNMPLDAAWLFTRGQEPKQVQKYDLSQHPRYHGLSHEREIAVSGKEHEPDWLPRLGE